MNAIVAVNSDWGIGFGGTQTIVIPEDRRRFNTLTDGGVVIAGRKTFEDYCKPLKNRKNIVLTHDRSFKAAGVIIAHSIDAVLAEIVDYPTDKTYVIGGGEIYRQFLPICSYAYVTKIEATPLSDTFFPDLGALPGWSLEIESGAMSDKTGIKYSYNVYRNIKR